MRMPRCAVTTMILAVFPLSLPLRAERQEPPRVIVFIVDGAGVGHWSLANLTTSELALREFPVVGLVDTRGANHIYTGSAASATAYATGERTFLNAIGVGMDSLPRKTVLELAEEQGMATGLVTTGRITDATPAAFATHVPNRIYEWEIARQLSLKTVTVLMGGGRDNFEAADRPDSTDLITPLRERYTFVEDTQGLRSLDMDTVTTLLGLFTPSDMPVYPERSPSLTEMTRATLEVLDKNPLGFFLMLETEQTDTQAHAHAPLEVLAGEMLDVNETILSILEYQTTHPETLVLVLGDHETGGLAIQTEAAQSALRSARSELRSISGRLQEIAALLKSEDSPLADSTLRFVDRLSTHVQTRVSEVRGGAILVARYTTPDHTVDLVPVFARGPGAGQFGGIIDNDRIGQLLLEAVRQ
jgi:alkaline phosphatase